MVVLKPLYGIVEAKPISRLLIASTIKRSVRTNLMARVSQIQGHEIRVVLYALLDNGDLFF